MSENYITPPSITEESKNKEYDYNNRNVTDTSKDHTKKGKLTCPDIKSPAMMGECGNKENYDNKKKKLMPILMI